VKMTDGSMPAMMDCEKAARALYDFLDGRTSVMATDQLQVHFTTCKKCAPHYEFSRRVLELMPRALPLDGNLGELRARIIRSLHEDGIEVLQPDEG
jgi:anti-sigma factor (TIGR02949 family)